MIFEHLQQFRQELYAETGKAKDALFDLMDAVLVSESITSFVSLSQSPVFRRKWPSVYAALKDSRLCANKVMKRVIGQVKSEGQPLLAVDRTLWLRPDAPTLRERTFGQPGEVGKSLGHSYSTIAWIPEGPGSWTLPLRHERISSFETALDRAAFQLKQVTKMIDERPLAALDREYGNGRFLSLTASVEADLLLRLRANACLFDAPPAYSGRGAPRKHGEKFKLNDANTWLTPSETIEVDDPKYGQVKLTRWSSLHFKQSPKREIELIRVEVLAPRGVRRKFKPLWLAWAGLTMPLLSQLWLLYLRRFTIEHWYRFAKQRLFWTHPQFSSTHASERWSLLMPLLSAQLWLARSDCQDSPLPWQSPQKTLSPGRVAQSFASILLAIGSPANPPKPRGKSPGRSLGFLPSPRTHFPSVKKHSPRPKPSVNSPPSLVPDLA
jgi:hypothetical protein